MIKRNADMTRTIKTNMRLGNGDVEVMNIVEQGEYDGKSRLIATLSFQPGSSIGEHVHENEEEIFYILEGTATYNDNGVQETLNVGDSCVCKGGQKHSISNQGDKKLTVLAIILTY